MSTDFWMARNLAFASASTMPSGFDLALVRKGRSLASFSS